MSEIKDLCRKIDHDNLTFYFKDKSINPIKFIAFRGSLRLYKDVFDGNIELPKAEKKNNQKQSKLDLNEKNKRKS